MKDEKSQGKTHNIKEASFFSSVCIFPFIPDERDVVYIVSLFLLHNIFDWPDKIIFFIFQKKIC